MSVKTRVKATDKAPWAGVENVGREIKEAGRHVWLAGLGALGAVDETSRGLFCDLVERGQRFEEQQRPGLEDRWRKAGDRIESFRHRVGQDVEEKVASTLRRFGVPARDQVQELIARIEQLTRQVESLTDRAKA